MPKHKKIQYIEGFDLPVIKFSINHSPEERQYSLLALRMWLPLAGISLIKFAILLRTMEFAERFASLEPAAINSRLRSNPKRIQSCEAIFLAANQSDLSFVVIVANEMKKILDIEGDDECELLLALEKQFYNLEIDIRSYMRTHAPKPSLISPESKNKPEEKPSSDTCPAKTSQFLANSNENRISTSKMVIQFQNKKSESDTKRIPRINLPSYSYFAKISRNFSRLGNSRVSTEKMIYTFQGIQGRLFIEKMLTTAIIQSLGIWLALQNDDLLKRASVMVLNIITNMVILCNFNTRYQVNHDYLLVELYHRYRKLVESGPEATHNPEATMILAAIHNELTVDQMEPWRFPTEKTDYSLVSDIYREILTRPPHKPNFSSSSSVMDVIANYMIFGSSLMRKAEPLDHLNQFNIENPPSARKTQGNRR